MAAELEGVEVLRKMGARGELTVWSKAATFMLLCGLLSADNFQEWYSEGCEDIFHTRVDVEKTRGVTESLQVGWHVIEGLGRGPRRRCCAREISKRSEQQDRVVGSYK